MEVDREIDVRGKVCPLPLITLAKEVRKMAAGTVISIVGDDPIFEESVIDFCSEGGHGVLEKRREGRVATVIFSVGGREVKDE